MKRLILLIIGVLFTSALTMSAQSASPHAGLREVLSQVARNNTQLQVARKELQSQQLANEAECCLSDPETEVAYLLGSPKGVPGRTNVSVKQTLEWDVLLGHRKQLAQSTHLQANVRYRQQLQQLMTEADQLYTQIIYTNRSLAELQKRNNWAEELSVLYQQKLQKGDVNQIEVNKMQLNAAVSRAELARARAQHDELLQQLQQLNGGQRIEVVDTLYPQANQQLPPLSQFITAVQSSPTVQLAQAKVNESQAAIKVAKANALPALTIGFQGEYIKQNNYSGLSVGFTLPLWGNKRRKVKQAETELLVQQLSVNDATQQQTAYVQQQYAQTVTLMSTAQQLAHSLQQLNNDNLLRRSLILGQMSLLDYLLEISFYYTARTAQLEAERDAQLALSALRCSVMSLD